MEHREIFRKRLKELVKPELYKVKFQDDYCYPLKLASNKDLILTTTQEDRIRLTCLQAQVAILYGLDQLPNLIGQDWQKYTKIPHQDLLNAYINMDLKKRPEKRHELTKNYLKFDSFKRLKSLSQRTFLAINNLNNIEWITLDFDSLEVYKKIEPQLKSQFDSYIGK